MVRIIKNVGPTQRRVDPKVVAKELGAETVGVTIDTRQGPISLFALRQFLVKRLRYSDTGQGPISLFALRQFLVKRLRYSDTRQGPISLCVPQQFLVKRPRFGVGRLALVPPKKRRNRIPLFDEDWIKLEKIAKYYKQKEGINVSPGQIASALIHTDVARIDISKIDDKDRRCFKRRITKGGTDSVKNTVSKSLKTTILEDTDNILVKNDAIKDIYL